MGLPGEIIDWHANAWGIHSRIPMGMKRAFVDCHGNARRINGCAWKCTRDSWIRMEIHVGSTDWHANARGIHECAWKCTGYLWI